MDYNTACQLRDALLADHSLSDFHDLPSHERVIKAIHAAGLAAAFVPLLTSRGQYAFHLAALPPQDTDRIQLSSEAEAPSKAYALIELKPLTAYIGELVTCDLGALWWPAPGAFSALASVIAPHWRTRSERKGGRMHWGTSDRCALEQTFAEHWSDHSQVLEPAAVIKPNRLRFTNLPLIPAVAGNHQ